MRAERDCLREQVRVLRDHMNEIRLLSDKWKLANSEVIHRIACNALARTAPQHEI